ncbi:MAG: hypothetical protein ACLP2X_14490 [Syntrophobacteraceae bacterium]
MSEGEGKSRVKALKVLIWPVICIILTAIITSSVNDYLARAKPYAEIVKMDLSRPDNKDIKIYPSPLVINLMRDCGIFIDRFSALHSTDEWQNLIGMVDEQARIFPSAESALVEMLTILKSSFLDSEARVNDVRVELMKRFDSVPMGILEPITISIFDSKWYIKKFQTDRKYEKYRSHLEIWKSPGQGNVFYAPGRYFKLYEVVEGKDKQDRLSSNIYRRLWIYMDKDIMINVFSDVLEDVKNKIVTVGKVVAEMKTQLEMQNPVRVHIVLGLSNLGKRSCIFKGDGRLEFHKSDGNVSLSINSFAHNQSAAAYAVNGETTMLVDYYSTDSVDQIEASKIKGFKSALQNKIYDCSLSIFRLTDVMKYDEIEVKSFPANLN